MTDLMIVMMFQDEITTGRKSNLCWRCLYYVTTNDCSNDTPASLQTLSCASKSLFYFIVDDGPHFSSPLLSSLSSQQIAKTLLMFFTWCEGKSCNPSGNPVVTRLGPARSQVTVMSPARDCLAVLCIATRQHITANWQYTFQSDNANLIFIVKYANFLRAGKLQSNINLNLPILFCDKLWLQSTGCPQKKGEVGSRPI